MNKHIVIFASFIFIWGLYALLHVVDFIVAYSIFIFFYEMFIGNFLLILSYSIGILRASIPYIFIFFGLRLLINLIHFIYQGRAVLNLFGVDLAQAYYNYKTPYWLFIVKEYNYIILMVLNFICFIIIFYYELYYNMFIIGVLILFYIYIAIQISFKFYWNKSNKKEKKFFHGLLNLLLCSIITVFIIIAGEAISNVIQIKIDMINYWFHLIQTKNIFLQKIRSEDESHKWFRFYNVYKNEAWNYYYQSLKKGSVLNKNILNQLTYTKKTFNNINYSTFINNQAKIKTISISNLNMLKNTVDTHTNVLNTVFNNALEIKQKAIMNALTNMHKANNNNNWRTHLLNVYNINSVYFLNDFESMLKETSILKHKAYSFNIKQYLLKPIKVENAVVDNGYWEEDSLMERDILLNLSKKKTWYNFCNLTFLNYLNNFSIFNNVYNSTSKFHIIELISKYKDKTAKIIYYDVLNKKQETNINYKYELLNFLKNEMAKLKKNINYKWDQILQYSYQSTYYLSNNLNDYISWWEHTYYFINHSKVNNDIEMLIEEDEETPSIPLISLFLDRNFLYLKLYQNFNKLWVKPQNLIFANKECVILNNRSSITKSITKLGLIKRAQHSFGLFSVLKIKETDFFDFLNLSYYKEQINDLITVNTLKGLQIKQFLTSIMSFDVFLVDKCFFMVYENKLYKFDWILYTIYYGRTELYHNIFNKSHLLNLLNYIKINKQEYTSYIEWLNYFYKDDLDIKELNEKVDDYIQNSIKEQNNGDDNGDENNNKENLKKKVDNVINYYKVKNEWPSYSYNHNYDIKNDLAFIDHYIKSNLNDDEKIQKIKELLIQVAKYLYKDNIVFKKQFLENDGMVELIAIQIVSLKLEMAEILDLLKNINKELLPINYNKDKLLLSLSFLDRENDRAIVWKAFIDAIKNAYEKFYREPFMEYYAEDPYFGPSSLNSEYSCRAERVKVENASYVRNLVLVIKEACDTRNIMYFAFKYNTTDFDLIADYKYNKWLNELDSESINNVCQYAVEELDELDLEFDIVLGLLQKVQEKHTDLLVKKGFMLKENMIKYQKMKDNVKKLPLHKLKKKASKEEFAFYVYLKQNFNYDKVKIHLNHDFNYGIKLIKIDTEKALKTSSEFYMQRLTQQLSDISTIREEDEKDIFEYLDNNKWLEELRQLTLTNQVRETKYQLYMTKKKQEALLNNFTYKKYEAEYFLKRDWDDYNQKRHKSDASPFKKK